MPITSSASISSLMRIEPNCAVAPAPIVAANATPAVAGAMNRTLRNAPRKPVSASIPTLDSVLYPCTAISAPVDSVRKPMMTTVPPITASAPVPIPITAISRNTSPGYRLNASPVEARA